MQVLLAVPERANEWRRKPNSAVFLGSRSALDRMLGGQVADLSVVRKYLDAECGGKARMSALVWPMTPSNSVHPIA